MGPTLQMLIILRNTFLMFLSEAVKKTRKRKLLIVIDAINQFDDAYNVGSLDWIPEILPPGII